MQRSPKYKCYFRGGGGDNDREALRRNRITFIQNFFVYIYVICFVFLEIRFFFWGGEGGWNYFLMSLFIIIYLGRIETPFSVRCAVQSILFTLLLGNTIIPFLFLYNSLCYQVLLQQCLSLFFCKVHFVIRKYNNFYFLFCKIHFVIRKYNNFLFFFTKFSLLLGNTIIFFIFCKIHFVIG